MYACVPVHMNEQRQENQLEPTYNRSGDPAEAKNDREGWRDRVRDIRTAGAT